MEYNPAIFRDFTKFVVGGFTIMIRYKNKEEVILGEFIDIIDGYSRYATYNPYFFYFVNDEKGFCGLGSKPFK